MVTRRSDAIRVVVFAFLAAFLLIGAGPRIAAAVGTLASGTATQIGVVPPAGENGTAQVRLSGTLPGGGVDLRTCGFTIDEVLVEDGMPPTELVLDRELAVPSFVGAEIRVSRGSKKNDASFDADSSVRPAMKVRFSDKGRGSLQFTLTVDRAVIAAPAAPLPTSLSTAFTLDCGNAILVFDNTATWRSTSGTNIRTP